MNITLKQLKYFAALAEHGHFGRAASALAISQPALSVQIRDLETELGQPLFERGPKGVQLTGFGTEFDTRARIILGQIDDLSQFARAASDLSAGQLRLGVIPTIAPYLLPRILPRLKADLPDLELGLRETVTPRLMDDLADGKIDAALVALPVDAPWAETVPLFDEAMVLVRHQTEDGAEVPHRKDLSSARVLMLEEGHCFRDLALDFCQIDRTARRRGLDGSSLSTLVQMVGAGFGMTLIPEMAVPVETRAAAVTTQRFSAPQPTRTVGMVWRKSTPLSTHLATIAALIRDAAADEVSP
ncbi:MAG: LysR substrate-binding domain-containing protein [Pseudomonadota bacterium]